MSMSTRLTLHVTVRPIRPKLWRRIVVPAQIKLNRLHAVIQAVIGAPDSPQHFFVDRQRTVYADPSWKDYPKIMSCRLVSLEELFCRRGDRLTHFCGDDDEWEHSIEVLNVTKVTGPVGHAVCLGGSRRLLGMYGPGKRRFSIMLANRKLREVGV